MTRTLVVAFLAGSLALPAFAQSDTIVCDDFLGMDNAQQMETLAEIQNMMSEEQASETGMGGQMTAEQIHERLTADCQSKPDALVVEVMKEMH
jgi:hypothetical protein